MTQTDWREIAARCGIPGAVLQNPTLIAAQMLCARGEREAAEAACREILHRRHGDVAAWRWLAAFFETQARFAEAEPCYRRAHEIDLLSSGLSGRAFQTMLRFRMAAEGYGRGPARAPSPYVSALFDRCAEDFNHHLRKDLRYRGPELVCGALQQAIGRRKRPLHILDAGCGTGLAAPLLRPLARVLDGVDLSAQMLERARRTSLYDHLTREDLGQFLAGHPGRYHAVVAVDVLVYFGNLAPVFTRARAALRRHGIFVFSVEAAPTGTYVLGPTRRYLHSEAYLRKAATAASFQVMTVRSETLRRESKKPVAGWIVVLRRVDSE
jgi:predicted TPR repeat methyltransferase